MDLRRALVAGLVVAALAAPYSRSLIEAQTAQISEALKAPGKIVAVVPMRQLLAEEGVLQRLRAQGYTVSNPGAHLTED